jgi:hypothetical protein
MASGDQEADGYRQLPDVRRASNTGVLRRLGRYAADVPIIRDPASVNQPYLSLGTHPDCVGRIWRDFNALLPSDCRWVVYRSPVLAHPRTGTIFALGGGTFYALRLAEHDLAAALALGAEQAWRYKPMPRHDIMATRWDLRKMGPTWIFGRWRAEEDAWIIRAYVAAEVQSRSD